MLSDWTKLRVASVHRLFATRYDDILYRKPDILDLRTSTHNDKHTQLLGKQYQSDNMREKIKTEKVEISTFLKSLCKKWEIHYATP